LFAGATALMTISLNSHAQSSGDALVDDDNGAYYENIRSWRRHIRWLVQRHEH
jgi:hypothetical protein